MTNITKAAQDALEALYAMTEGSTKGFAGSNASWGRVAMPTNSALNKAESAIAALRAALQDKAGEVPADGLMAQHDRDSAELRRLCQSRDSARRERDIARTEVAGLDASIGHLSRILSAQQWLIEESERLLSTDDFGAPLEDGDSELLDKIRSHIAAFGSPEAQPAPVVPDDHPLMVFAKECELGAYMEHEVPLAARKAIAASQKNGSAG